MNFKDIEKLDSVVSNMKKKCKCGHTQLVLKDKVLCSYCGHYIFKDKKTEFIYRMKEKLK